MDRRRVNHRVNMTSVKVWVDGREESQTGVHMETEVVLKCEGYINEGACGSATYAWVERGVHTSRRLQGNRHCLCAKHLECEKNTAHTILMSVTMKKIATTKTVASHSEENELCDGFVPYHRQPVFGSTRSEPSSCQANG